MKKTKLTRSLMAAVSIVALSAVMYGCVHSGDEPPAPPEMPDTSLMDAQDAADMAADAAEAAATAAEGAVSAVMANLDADEASYGVANNAAMRARAAATAARAASDAAAATMDADAAEAQQDIAEAKQAEAMAEQGNAEMYAGMVSDAHIERMALAAAMTGADTAAGLAEAAADAAEAARDTVVELTGADSMQSMAANAAATAARAAATAARSASDMAQDATMSGDAEGYQMTAEAQQGTAEGQRDDALELRRAAQVAADASGVQNEARDLEAAQDATADAAAEVNTHYMAAKGKAEMAAAQASVARAAANKAMAARTDYANADKYADMAEAASARAQAAMMRAMQANTDAHAANTAAMNAATSDDAEAEQAKAEAANVIATEAHTGTTGAGMAYMAAKDAAAKAVEAGPVHVRALLQAANATSLSGAANEARVTEVAGAIATAAAAAPGGTVSATWMGDTVDDPATEDVDESMEGMLMISADVDGTGSDEALTFRTAFVADTEDGTPGNQPGAKTATEIDGIGDFPTAYEISEGGVHAIVFTNKEQGADSTLAGTLSFTNRLVTDLSRIVRADPETPITLDGDGDLEGAAYDHDDDVRTAPIAIGSADTNVMIGCSVAGECTFQLENGELDGVLGDGSLTATYSRAFDAGDPGDDVDYLIFGVWLQEDSNGDTAGSPPAAGAFSGGGRTFATPETLVGKATYNGSATGVYTEGTKVDYFSASATLTADFDKIDEDESGGADDELGTITGRIHNIVAGGYDSSDVILLNSDADPTDGNIAAAGTFSGLARMGTPTITDDVAEYDYNGVWEGDFLGAPAAAGATGVDRLPPSASGTFGVTGTDDMDTADDTSDDVIRSYIGAFGAER